MTEQLLHLRRLADAWDAASRCVARGVPHFPPAPGSDRAGPSLPHGFCQQWRVLLWDLNSPAMQRHDRLRGRLGLEVQRQLEDRVYS